MNWDLILLIIFFLFLFAIFKIYRHKFEVQMGIFALYKTQLGIKLMDKIANKFPRLLNFFSNISIFIGFLGMVFTLFFLVKGAVSFFSLVPQPQVAPVLPGLSIAGLPALSFWHWIISILIAAAVHEFMHGVYARLNKVRIKSSGFAFLGPILAAFVEPDEKDLAKKSTKAQLSVLSAGPFTNIVFGILILIFMIFVLQPVANSLISVQGIEISSLNESFPIINSGIKSGYIITEVGNEKISSINNLKTILDKYSPGDSINIKANEKDYNIILGSNPSNKTQAYLGIAISGYKLGIGNNSSNGSDFFTKLFMWFALLLFWLFNINVGIGLFNLLPLGPVDGGRMFYVSALHFTKNKIKALRILNIVTIIVLFLIIINMWPFIAKLFSFIFSPILSLF